MGEKAKFGFLAFLKRMVFYDKITNISGFFSAEKFVNKAVLDGCRTVSYSVWIGWDGLDDIQVGC